MHSMVFIHVEVSEIGRYIIGSYLDPFLKIGTMVDCFQSKGSESCSREDLKIKRRGYAIWDIEVLSRSRWTPSGPIAEEVPY